MSLFLINIPYSLFERFDKREKREREGDDKGDGGREEGEREPVSFVDWKWQREREMKGDGLVVFVCAFALLTWCGQVEGEASITISDVNVLLPFSEERAPYQISVTGGCFRWKSHNSELIVVKPLHGENKKLDESYGIQREGKRELRNNIE